MTDADQTNAATVPLTLDIDAIRKLADEAGSAIVPAYFGSEREGLPSLVPVFLDRNSGQAHSLKKHFEEYRTHPERKRGTATVTTLESFIDLVDRHQTGNSAIFANTDWNAPSFTAVIDYHELEGGRADNGQHRIHYPFPLSDEWKAWKKQSGEVLTQAEFAEWIEDRIADLAAPTDDERREYEDTFGLKTATPAEIVTLSRGSRCTPRRGCAATSCCNRARAKSRSRKSIATPQATSSSCRGFSSSRSRRSSSAPKRASRCGCATGCPAGR